MNYLLMKKKWIHEEIDKTLRATYEQRLETLDSIQQLYVIAMEQNGAPLNPKGFEEEVAQRVLDSYQE